MSHNTQRADIGKHWADSSSLSPPKNSSVPHARDTALLRPEFPHNPCSNSSYIDSSPSPDQSLPVEDSPRDTLRPDEVVMLHRPVIAPAIDTDNDSSKLPAHTSPNIPSQEPSLPCDQLPQTDRHRNGDDSITHEHPIYSQHTHANNLSYASSLPNNEHPTPILTSSHPSPHSSNQECSVPPQSDHNTRHQSASTPHTPQRPVTGPSNTPKRVLSARATRRRPNDSDGAEQEHSMKKARARDLSATFHSLGPHRSSARLVLSQFKELARNPPDGISIDLENGNAHKWKILMVGPPGTLYEGGIFPCTLSFPPEYPDKPPVFTFLTPNFIHPNVFPDGKVCISILHDPKEPHHSHEPSNEKWRPILGIEQVLVSVMSLLAEPNCDSPANSEYSRMFQEDYNLYRKKVIMMVRRTQEDPQN